MHESLKSFARACPYRYHDTTAAGIQAFHGPHKILRHRPVNALGQFQQRFRFNAHYFGTSGFHSE